MSSKTWRVSLEETLASLRKCYKAWLGKPRTKIACCQCSKTWQVANRTCDKWHPYFKLCTRTCFQRARGGGWRRQKHQPERPPHWTGDGIAGISRPRPWPRRILSPTSPDGGAPVRSGCATSPGAPCWEWPSGSRRFQEGRAVWEFEQPRHMTPAAPRPHAQRRCPELPIPPNAGQPRRSGPRTKAAAPGACATPGLGCSGRQEASIARPRPSRMHALRACGRHQPGFAWNFTWIVSS